LLLETGGSGKLFGGHARLHRRIERGLAALGFKRRWVYATTPQAAWWIAAARALGVQCPDAVESGQLKAALAPLPLRLTGWDTSTLETLHALGLATLGDVLVLPRDQVNRRFGNTLLADLDRALGHLPIRNCCSLPPQRFSPGSICQPT